MPDEIKSINQHEVLANTVTEDEVNILVEQLSAGTDPATQEHLKVVLGDIIKKGHYTKSEIAALLDGKISTSAKGAANGVASLDANGKIPSSQIPSSVATLADLAAEVSSREAKDADLQSQIVNTNAELDNVEALIGGDAQVENTDPTEGESLLAQSRLIHHANLLPNGDFGRVGARSVAWNQIIHNGNFADISMWTVSSSGVTFSVSNNVATISYTEAYRGISQQISFLKGHQYLVHVDLKKVDADAEVQFAISDNLNFTILIPTTNVGISWTSVEAIVSTNTDIGPYTALFIRNGSSGYGSAKSVQARNVMLFDLTAMNMASLTVDQFRSKFPASYYPYNTGEIFDLNPSGFRIRGINLWNEEWEVGAFDSQGEKKTGNYIITKDLIPVSPNTTYYSKAPAAMWVREYNSEGVYLGIYESGFNTAFTTSVRTHYISLELYGNAPYTTYGHDIQICLDSLPASIKTVHHPSEHHTVYTPQIADGNYVNDTIYDYVENVEEDGIVKGKKHKKVGSYTFDGTESWSRNGTFGFFYTLAFSSLIKPTQDKDAVANIICSMYAADTPKNVQYGTNNKTISVGLTGWLGAGVIGIHDSTYNDATTFASAMAGMTINYELASETITDCEPLRSFNISDYSTVEPVTPQTELINRIDVPFSVKTISANTIIAQIQANAAAIASEVATRTAQISALDKRVKNLELKTGDQFDVDYPSSTYGVDGVPDNVEPYAKVGVIKAKVRAWNRIELSEPRGVETSNVIITYDSTTETFTITGTADANSSVWLYKFPNVIGGHAYLIGNTAPNVKVYLGNVSDNYAQYILAEAHATSTYVGIRLESGKVYNDTFKILTRDLTVMFPELTNVQMSSLGIAGLVARCPSLLDYDEYGYRAVQAVVSEARSKARNLVNPSTLTQDKYVDDGSGNLGNNTTFVASDYIDVIPTQSYYYTTDDSRGRWGAWYDENKVYISGISGIGVKVAPPNAKYARVTGCKDNYTTRLCFNISDSLDGTVTPYRATSTLSISPASSGNSAGSVYDTDELNVEVMIDGQKVKKRRKTQNIVKRIFGTGWVLRTDGNLAPYFYKDVSTWGIAFETSSAAKNNIFCVFYRNVERTGLIGGDMVICTDGDVSNITQLQIKDSRFNSASDFSDFIKNEDFYYETKNPTVTLSDPVEDPYIEVEPNGTVRTIQSQTPEVDSAMTIEYMAS